MRALITGAAGQLATDLARWCAREGDDVRSLSRRELDISDKQAVADAIGSEFPDVVFNCAAWTEVDACETDPAKATLVNGEAVKYLGAASETVGAHLVHLSTDYVFDGESSRPYIEGDPTNPQSVYGASKLLGERYALEAGASVVRTSWVCSAHGGNMVETILRLGRNHETLRFVSDQRGHPTFTADLAPALRQLGVNKEAGLIHVTNAGAVSWFEFARAVFETAGLNPERIEAIQTSELLPARPASRPANSVLSNEHIATLGYATLRDFRDALAEVVPEYGRR